MKAPARISALVLGLVAFMTLGGLVLLYVTGVGADVMVALIKAVTPPP